MIIKGTSCAGARRLAVHLTRVDTNERAEIKEIRSTVADDLAGALKEMEAVAAGARTTKPFYHGSINTRADERLTDEQRMRAIDKLEAELGLTGQPRVVVIHHKNDREHCHIVWSRIDLDRMAAISDSFNYIKHEVVARPLEREFGHERVQGAHVERDGKERPERTPSHREMLQAERTGLRTSEAKGLMTEIWKTTGTGKEFKAALEEKGWILARGDRRDFVAIDQKGGIHSLARRIDGAKVADIRQRFADINPKTLMSVAEAKQIQRGRFPIPERQKGEQRQQRPQQRSAARQAQQGPSLPKQRIRLRPPPLRVGTVLSKILLGGSSTPRPPPSLSLAQEQDAASQRRQELLRQLSRDVPSETERDAIIERDRGRERDRG